MKFSVFLSTLSDAEAGELESEWHKCRQILTDAGAPQRQFAINLEDDSHLCESAWETIRRVILQGIAIAAELQRGLRDACRQHMLQGDFIGTPFPTPLGRAVTREAFADVLRDQFSFNTPSEEEQFMDDLLQRGATVTDNRVQLGGKLLAKGGRVMWATFVYDADTASFGDDPFAGLPPNADGIRAHLGLSRNDTGKDLLLFVYTLPRGVVPRFPTIAEAYAGDDWFYYFRPAREAEPWGYTMTWDLPTPPAPYPEVVHGPVTGDNLVEKIRVARGR
jgi:hypothetical protein